MIDWVSICIIFVAVGAGVFVRDYQWRKATDRTLTEARRERDRERRLARWGE